MRGTESETSLEHGSPQPSDSSGGRPTRGGRQVGGRRAGRRPLADAGPAGLGGAAATASPATAPSRQFRRNETPKQKGLSAHSLTGRRRRLNGLPTRVASGNPSPARFPQPLLPRPPPEPAGPASPAPRSPNPGRLAASPGLGEADRLVGRPPARPGGRRRSPGVARSVGPKGTSRPGAIPPRPQPPAPRRGVRGGARPGPLPAGPASGAPQPTVATALLPSRRPESRGPSPPSASPSFGRAALAAAPRGRSAEPGLRPPRPRSPRPRDAVGRPPVRRYLVVVVGVPLLQEGGGRRLVLLLELRADGRPPALRLLRRRGRRGLLLR